MNELTIGELARRSGVATSAIRFWEMEGLVTSERTSGNQRRFHRAALRRVAIIRAGQEAGLSLGAIRAALETLPHDRTPTKRDWERLSRSWRSTVEQRIVELEALRDQLGECIGCGCLSLRSCGIFNHRTGLRCWAPARATSRATAPPTSPTNDATALACMGFSRVMEEEICQRLAADLDGAFSSMVRALQGDIYAGLRRLHGGDAEDLAQETFIRAYRALLTYDPDRIRTLQLRPWIWTIALNLGRNLVRDRSRRPTPVELEDRHGAPDPDPVDTEAWDRRLGELPPHQRKAVVLRHVVGMSVAETAAALGRPEGTVKADVHRGLEKLRTILETER